MQPSYFRICKCKVKSYKPDINISKTMQTAAVPNLWRRFEGICKLDFSSSDGSLCMCVDYRQLNKRTIRYSYALPRTEEFNSPDTLSGSKYFTVLDMKSGYHQVELLEEHKCRSAFTVGPLEFWEFICLPFGLCNAPASYQRLMEQCLGDLNMKICCIYLDDLIIFSDTLEEHLERLNTVLNRLK